MLLWSEHQVTQKAACFVEPRAEKGYAAGPDYGMGTWIWPQNPANSAVLEGYVMRKDAVCHPRKALEGEMLHRLLSPKGRPWRIICLLRKSFHMGLSKDGNGASKIEPEQDQ